MIQLTDIEQNVINPAHIILLKVNDNPMVTDCHDFTTKKKLATNKKGGKVTIVMEINCMLNYYGWGAFLYDCVEACKSDYHKILKATNANYNC